MEVLDTSIANVALPHLAGNLGASNDECTWVLTSYLVCREEAMKLAETVERDRKAFIKECFGIDLMQMVLDGLSALQKA